MAASAAMFGEQSYTLRSASRTLQMTSASIQIYVSSTVQPASTACAAALSCASQCTHVSCIHEQATQLYVLYT
eukprot:11672-Heterococcus_DN1.PRE.2